MGITRANLNRFNGIRKNARYWDRLDNNAEPAMSAEVIYDMNNFFTNSSSDNYIKDTGSTDIIKDALCCASNHVWLNGTTQYIDYPVTPTTLGFLWFDTVNKYWSRIVSFPDVTFYHAVIPHSNACMLNIQPTGGDITYLNLNPNALVEMAYGIAHPGLSFTKANMQAYYVGNEGVNGYSGVNDIMYTSVAGSTTFYSSKTTAQTYTMRMPVGTTVTINGIVYNGNGGVNVVGTITGVGDVNIVESPAGCLTYFYCNTRQLTGSIPDLSANTALTLFQCYENNLTGLIPNLSSNTSLTNFMCQTNSLTGSIPNLSANTALTVFQCNSNKLTGSIPNLNANTALTTFYCNVNQLTGSLPNLSNNTALAYFYCTTNQLTGPIPDLSSNTLLVAFYCNGNQLTGSIPNLSSTTSLVYFMGHENKLTGLIPNLSSNASLAYFYCYTNQLTGYSGGNIKITTAFNASSNLLTQSAIDSILQGLVDGGTTGAVAITLNGTGNSAPSAAGISNKNILIGRGCTVTTN